MLRIRPFRAEDSEKIVLWISNSLSFYQWSAGRLGDYPMSADRLSEYYADPEKCGDAMAFTAFDESGALGHFIIRFLDAELKHARLGFIIVDSSQRGKGLGGEMLSLAVSYCRDMLKAEDVSLGVFLNNPGAVRCYEKAGFTPERTIDMSVNGEQWECMEMRYIM